MSIITKHSDTLTPEQRIEQWRFHRDVQTTLLGQDTGPCAPSHDGAVFSTEDLNGHDDEESWWQACLGLIGLIVFLIGTAVAMTLMVDEQEPIERCFKAADTTQSYCREQRQWEIGNG